ncbi:hypothetical protein HYV79_02335 [Candidatus Woesearchaeota archaeon]|nr:hypothetical protein [Candidatus Woesearchaeota archaeon]
MKAKIISLLVLFCLLIISVNAVPVNIDNVKINDIKVSEDAITLLNIERGSELDVEVHLTAVEKSDNLELQAFISGFEYSDVEQIADFAGPFSVEPNVTYVKNLKLKLSDLVEKDDYKLRLVVSDKDGTLLIKTYKLHADVPRHLLKVKDVILTPRNVKAGHSLIAQVRVENKGEKEETDVKVIASVPELGLEAVDYIEKLKNNEDEDETEELYLKIDACTKPKTYTLNVDVYYDQLHRKLATTKVPFIVTPSSTCNNEELAGLAGLVKSQVIISSVLDTVEQGQSTIFPITVVNKENVAKTFTITLQESEGISVTVQPSVTVLVQPNQAYTFNVFVTAESSSKLGKHALTADLRSGSDLIIAQQTLTLNVKESSSAATKSILEIGLLVLIIVLIILGFVIGVTRVQRDDKKKEYY